MNRNRFKAEVRPHLTEIPIGKRGIAFERSQLDAWADEYVAKHGRPVEAAPPKPEMAAASIEALQRKRVRDEYDRVMALTRKSRRTKRR